MTQTQLYPDLALTIDGFREIFLSTAFASDSARDKVRSDLSGAIREAQKRKEVLALNFICTHNSRRSQIAQLWAVVAAARYGNDFVRAYSGGTEVTALHPNVIESLIKLGFRVEGDPGQPGRHLVYFSADYPPAKCWSKLYNDPANPAEDFMAIMVCDDADANCPLIPTARRRLSLRYTDPKFSDGTEQEADTYQRTVREIGSEIFSLFDL